MFESFLDPIFAPLLDIPSFWSIFLLSLLIALIITLIYKFATNQKEMKRLKDEMKEHQKEVKDHKDDPQKMMEINKVMMQKNMQYMSHSFKSMIFTFLPIILIFGWMNTNLAYENIMPGQEFTTTMNFKESLGSATIEVPEGIELLNEAEQLVIDKKASWALKGETGEYILVYNTAEEEFEKEVTITEGHEYSIPEKKVKSPLVKSIKINNDKIYPIRLFGLKLNWFWSYIVFSLVLTTLLRKLLKVY